MVGIGDWRRRLNGWRRSGGLGSERLYGIVGIKKRWKEMMDEDGLVIRVVIRGVD